MTSTSVKTDSSINCKENCPGVFFFFFLSTSVGESIRSFQTGRGGGGGGGGGGLLSN
jgi:hypothetical protein